MTDEEYKKLVAALRRESPDYQSGWMAGYELGVEHGYSSDGTDFIFLLGLQQDLSEEEKP